MLCGEDLHVIVPVGLDVSVPPKMMPFTFDHDPFHVDQSAALQFTVSDGDLLLNIVRILNSQPILPMQKSQLLRLVIVLVLLLLSLWQEVVLAITLVMVGILLV